MLRAKESESVVRIEKDSFRDGGDLTLNAADQSSESGEIQLIVLSQPDRLVDLDHAVAPLHKSCVLSFQGKLFQVRVPELAKLALHPLQAGCGGRHGGHARVPRQRQDPPPTPTPPLPSDSASFPSPSRPLAAARLSRDFLDIWKKVQDSIFGTFDPMERKKEVKALQAGWRR